MTDTTWVNGQLAELRFHWGSAYMVWCNAPGRWTAERRDGKGTLSADSAGELWEKIRADYFACPVPRR